jgi:DNA-binding response OmpR family regulator
MDTTNREPARQELDFTIKDGTGAPRILIVDDEELVCWSLMKVLQKAGFQVVVAHTAQAAIEAFLDCPADLLISDLNLPDLSGDDLARQVRALRPACKVIIISAFGEEEAKCRARKAGAAEFLDKPLSLPEIIWTVKRHLQ